MNFRASFCDPFKPDVIELGDMEQGKIMEYFEKIPWKDYLDKMKFAKESEIYYSPSFGVENIETKNSLEFSALGDNDWYIFFKRPKVVGTFLGFFKKLDPEYLSDISGNTADAKVCLKALLDNNLKFLEDKF